MKFAHIADAHLGAFSKNETLRNYNLEAFRRAIEISVEEGVDFIIIAGDLFHNPLPDMDIVRRTVEILNLPRERGIPVYVVYGSHDFSAGTTSLLDVLAEAGVFIRVTRYEMHDGRIRLLPVEDKSGVKIVGMPGLTSAMEVRYFTEDMLDLDYLEKIPSPKIFVLHTTIAELKPEYIADKNAVPLSKIPRGFDYYAAGHLHERIVGNKDGAPLIYPGALFGATYSDLDVLTGKERGFYIVEEFEPRFVPVKVCEFEKKVYDATGKTAKSVEKELLEFASLDHGGRVVILKVRGELKSGKVADIDFRGIREEIMKTASDALLNTYSLSTAERKAIRVPARDHEEIESRVFAEISDYGEDFTRSLFRILKEEKREDEKRYDFENRLWSSARALLLEAAERGKVRRVKKEEKMGGEEKGEERAEKKKEKAANKRERKARTLFDFG